MRRSGTGCKQKANSDIITQTAPCLQTDFLDQFASSLTVVVPAHSFLTHTISLIANKVV